MMTTLASCLYILVVCFWFKGMFPFFSFFLRSRTLLQQSQRNADYIGSFKAIILEKENKGSIDSVTSIDSIIMISASAHTLLTSTNNP